MPKDDFPRSHIILCICIHISNKAHTPKIIYWCRTLLYEWTAHQIWSSHYLPCLTLPIFTLNWLFLYTFAASLAYNLRIKGETSLFWINLIVNVVKNPHTTKLHQHVLSENTNYFIVCSHVNNCWINIFFKN